jgi:hypothetical protein
MGDRSAFPQLGDADVQRTPRYCPPVLCPNRGGNKSASGADAIRHGLAGTVIQVSPACIPAPGFGTNRVTNHFGVSR